MASVWNPEPFFFLFFLIFGATPSYISAQGNDHQEFLGCNPSLEQCKFIQCGYNSMWTAWIPYQTRFTNFACCGDRIFDMRKHVCEGIHLVKCYPDETFHCPSTGNCVSKSLVCNGVNDCSDGGDEVGCDSCAKDQFRCQSGECVSQNYMCDMEKHCSDGSDESYCARNDGGWCGSNRFRCPEKCIPMRHVCDGSPDCINGLDEENCHLFCDPTNSSLDCFRGTCHEGQLFSIPRQQGIFSEWGCCGGVVHHRRESYCSLDHEKLEPCDLASSFWCNNGNCVDKRHSCDGVNHCSDGSDEFNCARTSADLARLVRSEFAAECQREPSFHCAPEGPCFSPSAVCDRIKHCPGGEDESNCLTDDGGWCSPGWFRCGSDCLEREKICDGTAQCEDDFDETNCTVSSTGIVGAGYTFKSVHLMQILIGVAAFFLLIILCLAGVHIKYRKGRRREETPSTGAGNLVILEDGPVVNEKTGFISLESLRYIIDFKNAEGSVNTLQTSISSDVDSLDADSHEKMSLLIDTKLIVNRDQISLGPTIGCGHFGNVNRGSLFIGGQSGHGPGILVAIKTLHRNNSNPKSVNQFLEEALIMKDLMHPNVMQLLAICLIGRDCPMVVLPYMQNGNLLNFIRDGNRSPNIGDMLKFALDVARGMAYLVECRIIHRDLAARNCMLDYLYTAKVADFGLSRDVYEREYYSKQDGKAKLPVRWMAVESIASGKYTYASDCWSYGVLLWELMTRGNCPYSDVDTWDVVNYLQAGRRLAQPEYCPTDLYKIMLSCWHPIPEKRPTFRQVIALITGMHARLRPRENLQVSTECNYKYLDLSKAYVNDFEALGNYQTLMSTYVNSQTEILMDHHYLQPVKSVSPSDASGDPSERRLSMPPELAPPVPNSELLADRTDALETSPKLKPPVPPKPKVKPYRARTRRFIENASSSLSTSQRLLPEASVKPEICLRSSSLPNLLDEAEVIKDQREESIEDQPYCEFSVVNL